MRVPAVLVPAILLLAGTVYFLARARTTGPPVNQAPSEVSADRLADNADGELIRDLLANSDLAPDRLDTLLRAAGRRYMRRKLAYTAAAGSAPGDLERLRRDMEAARKVCDVAESLGQRTALSTADSELESRFFYMPSAMLGLLERYNGTAAFTEADLADMQEAFLKHFGRPLPVSARGDTAVHRTLGFDHRGRFDVALSPSLPEGIWARQYLTGRRVTFFAFRGAVPGKATGAHIHIGPASTHRIPKG